MVWNRPIEVKNRSRGRNIAQKLNLGGKNCVKVANIYAMAGYDLYVFDQILHMNEIVYFIEKINSFSRAVGVFDSLP